MQKGYILFRNRAVLACLHMNSFAKKPNISIIIPALNEEAYIARVLQSIREQNYNGAIQVIVVDGGSTDKTKEIVQNFRMRFSDFELVDADKGVSLARNRGAERAKHDIILFLDADMAMPRGFMNAMVSHIPKNADFVALASHRPISKNLLDYFFTYAFFFAIYIFRAWHPICSGSFLLTTKRNHRKIGGFDERLKIMGEDVDYGKRSIKFGARYIIWLRPQILASPRRLQEQGRLRLAWTWVSAYWYSLFVGPLHEDSGFLYSFGSHKPEQDKRSIQKSE